MSCTGSEPVTTVANRCAEASLLHVPRRMTAATVATTAMGVVTSATVLYAFRPASLARTSISSRCASPGGRQAIWVGKTEPASSSSMS